jgi:DNA-binding protein H-NS
MALEDLWSLHERLIEVLDRKMESEKRRLESQLNDLGRRFDGSHKSLPQRRSYPKVERKFRNPNDSQETWSGRGKPPRWVVDLLAAGRSLDDIRIQQRGPSSIVCSPSLMTQPLRDDEI